MLRLKIILKDVLICALTAHLFFHTWWSLIVLIPFFFYRFRRELDHQEHLQKKRIEEQFRDALQCLLAALEAGYSMENSILHAGKDLRTMFGEKEPIVREFRWMEYKLQNGSSAENLLEELAERSESEEMRNFAGLYAIARRTGGDVIKVIRSVTDILYQKHEVRREIQTVLLAKQLEVTIMKVMPYAILLYFQVFSSGFLKPLYEGLAGHLLMAGIYVMYLFCCRAAETIAMVRI